MRRKRRKRKKYQPKEIKGLTWKQKLSLEAALEFAIDRSLQEEHQEWGEDSNLRLSTSFRALLALLRKKTKHMRHPRQRRRRKSKLPIS